MSTGKELADKLDALIEEIIDNVTIIDSVDNSSHQDMIINRKNLFRQGTEYQRLVDEIRRL